MATGYNASLVAALRQAIEAVGVSQHASGQPGYALSVEMALVLATRYPDELCAVRSRARKPDGPTGDWYDDDFAALCALLHGINVPAGALTGLPVQAAVVARHAATAATRELAAELCTRFQRRPLDGVTVFERSIARSRMDGAAQADAQGGGDGDVAPTAELCAMVQRQLVDAPSFSAYEAATYVQYLCEDALTQAASNIAPVDSSGGGLFRSALPFYCIYARPAEVVLDAGLLQAHTRAQETLRTEMQWLAAVAVERLVRAAATTDVPFVETVRRYIADERPKRRLPRSENNHPGAIAERAVAQRMAALV